MRLCQIERMQGWVLSDHSTKMTHLKDFVDAKVGDFALG